MTGTLLAQQLGLRNHETGQESADMRAFMSASFLEREAELPKPTDRVTAEDVENLDALILGAGSLHITTVSQD